MKLYLIRHGQSVANLNKIHSGWGQFGLTEKGQEDARRAGRLLEGVRFDAVYSSDLLRAMETQQLALPDAHAERSMLLREINVGNLSGKPFEELYLELGEGYLEDRRLFDFSKYGGEAYEQLYARIRSFLDFLEESEYESVAVFCHGGWINTMIDVITGFRTYRPQFKCENGSISVFEFKDGAWALKLWNYTGKL